MTRVDFYILQDVDLTAAQRFACRLTVKALSSGSTVHVHVDDQSSAQAFDDLLWQYPEQRFVPHACEDAADADAPVVIGWNPPRAPDGLLINLASSVPTFFGRFERVAEIVVEARREDGRDRYRFYRNLGYPLFHHELDDWEAA